MIKKQILILEVNEQNYHVLRTLFEKNNIETSSVLNKEEFENIESKIEEYDLLLVNSHISYATVQEVVNLANFSVSLKLPIIYLDNSNEHSKVILQECFEHGVADYIKKPFDSKEIVFRIIYHSEQFLKLKEFKLRVDKLANLATIDQLSKSTSKMHMQAILKHKISYYNRYKVDTSVIYLSLLNVNKIVGSFGLEKGEKLISHFAKELKANIRESDVLARWAGSDFIILLTNTSIEAAEFIAKKLNTKLSTVEILPHVKPELAFGITTFSDGDELKDILDRAKYALGEAKKQTYGKIYIS
ncbi:diguanylate cyclase domain-containing protein [Sulfurimonas sp.]